MDGIDAKLSIVDAPEFDESGSASGLTESDCTGRAIRCRLREYHRATSIWADQTLEMIMRAMDEVYGQIPHVVGEGPASTIAQLSASEAIHIEAQRIRAHSNVDVEAVVRGDLDNLHEVVVNLAEQVLPQVLGMYFDTISQVTDQTGNSVKSSGDLVETYIEAIEKMDIAFDKRGRPNFQYMASPENAAKMEVALANMTAEQAARLDEVLRRKRDEYIASRRSRRLPRLSD